MVISPWTLPIFWVKVVTLPPCKEVEDCSKFNMVAISAALPLAALPAEVFKATVALPEAAFWLIVLLIDAL